MLKNGDEDKIPPGLRSRDLKQKLAQIDRVMSDPQSRETMQVLLQALQDDSWHLRHHAAQALVHIGAKAVSPLIRLLTEGVWFVRSSAALALGELGREQAVEHLLRLLGDENRTVRSQAVLALAKISLQVPPSRMAVLLAGQPLDVHRQILDSLQKTDRNRSLELAGLLAQGNAPELGPPHATGDEGSSAADVLRRFRQALEEIAQGDPSRPRNRETDHPPETTDKDKVNGRQTSPSPDSANSGENSPNADLRFWIE